MARPEVTGRKISANAAKKKKPKPVELVPHATAFSIREFCAAHRISESLYFKIWEKGLGPREARVATRVIITQEAAADWRRQRETTAA